MTQQRLFDERDVTGGSGTVIPPCNCWHPFPNDGYKIPSWPYDPLSEAPEPDETAISTTISTTIYSSEKKETNPKDLVGCRKVPVMSVVPQNVIARVAKVLLSGAYKYARHNYREVGVRASVYVDAATGHLGNFWEGEDSDPDSLESHIINAIAGLVVLADSMDQDNWVDDRPPKSKVLPRDKSMNQKVSDMLDSLQKTYGEPKKPCTEK